MTIQCHDDFRVVGVSGSPRARFHDLKEAIDTIRGVGSYQDLYTKIYDLASYKKISNTEALLWMALFGAHQKGANIDLVHLNKLTNDKMRLDKELIKQKVEKAQGILLASPVYFGDYSSFIASFFESFYLEEKVVGVVSAGAKRNGGQETTNIYSLYEAMSRGASVVGNGPPTSQYGGTGWAGDIGTILDDNFGLDTSLGTGRRVMEIVMHTRSEELFPAKVGMITYEPEREGDLERQVRGMLKETGNVELHEINLSEYKINFCVGCSVCPNKEMEPGEYGCIQKDDMEKINAKMWGLDAIVVMANNDNLKAPYWKNFKVFIERTRYLRRGHFVLSDLPVFVIQRNNFRKSQNIAIRIVTFFLRHNTFICGPIWDVFYDDDKVIYQDQSVEAMCEKIVRYAGRHNGAKDAGFLNGYRYIPVGYGGLTTKK